MKVSFAGIMLMDDAEGNYSFDRGVFPRRGRDFVSLARAESRMMRELSTPGCQHMVELRYYGVDANMIRNRLRMAYEHGVGTLYVGDNTPINFCALASAPQLSGRGSSSRASGGVRHPGITVSLVFEQLVWS